MKEKRNIRYFIKIILLLIIAFFAHIHQVYGAHGLSIDQKLKYPKGFEHFQYTSTSAVKGGDLVLRDIGSFDKMNPYTLRGLAPFGLDRFVFESLAVSSLDEPFTKYGLIAEDIAISQDRLSMLITLDKNAKFSDGTSITSEDVFFSLNMMKSDKVHPRFADYYHDIQGAEIIDSHHIKFMFSKVNRELPLIALDIPVFSQKYYLKNTFGSNEKLSAPLGSGPYVVEKILPGKTIRYKRNSEYWARDKNVNRNRYNFDTITIKYFKDRAVAVEAFKAGVFDLQLVNIAKQWARDLKGAKFDNGKIKKTIFPHNNNAGIQGFVINTRKKLFRDVRVREALGLALDFEWTNKSLFFNQYSRSNSFFSNSYLAAKGMPTGLELQYLKEFEDILSPRIFTTPLIPPENSKKGDFRKNLRKARSLLAEAGWKIKDGALKNIKGDIFTFEILILMPSFGRVMAPYVKNLEKLGIQADYRLLDQALYKERIQNFDFDMTVHVFGQSQSPGNEQRNYWHSDAAERKGAGNLAGIKNKAVDALVEKIVYATSQEELTAACKALDRVLWYGFYVVPNWYLGGHRLVYYNKFGIPDNLPLYYDHIQLLTTWWIKDNKIE